MSDPAATPGTRLKAERERRGLSAQKAADEMHLDRWVIDALEADDYQRIGPAVYAKGHLKKYAGLLGLPAAEILAGYASQAREPSEPVSVGPSMMLSSRDEGSSFSNLSPAQIVGGLVVLLLAMGVVWWKPWHQRGKEPVSAPVAAVAQDAASAGKPEQAAVISSAATAAAAADVNETPPSPTEPAAETSHQAAATAPAALTPVEAANAPGSGHARLRLSFSADSWVDVRDASGKRVYAGNGPANSVKTIAGAGPMRVYLGSGNGVQLEINDRAVAIGRQFFAGDVARFEAGADGVLRRDSHPEQTHGTPPRSQRPPG
jgi:cytoskeleton protein RodZ